jgi:flagellar basal-body rod protein FlgC
MAAIGLFSAMDVASSGLTVERTRMNTIASNLANARTTRTNEGGPYRRLDPVFSATPLNTAGTPGFDDPTGSAISLAGVSGIQRDQRDPVKVYEPGHPDADAEGYVRYPNVNAVEEMVNMMAASRAYEVGVSSVETIKSMAKTALGIGRG